MPHHKGSFGFHEFFREMVEEMARGENYSAELEGEVKMGGPPGTSPRRGIRFRLDVRSLEEPDGGQADSRSEQAAVAPTRPRGEEPGSSVASEPLPIPEELLRAMESSLGRARGDGE